MGDEENNTSQDDSAGQVEEKVEENGLGEEEETVQNGEDEAKEGAEGQEDDSLNIMIGDEDNLFEEESSEMNKPNGLKRQPSPPRPETAPVKHPFTSKDTINLATRGGKAPSDNSSMLVNPDESQSVASHESGDGFKENDEKKDDEDDKGEEKVEAKEEGEGKEEEGKETDEKKKVVSSSRNLWISGLSSTTRATDLKVVFSKWGKVVGAKMGTNARTPGARCYGYVTMNSSEDASACIKNMNRTELHGKMITVERAKVESSSSGSGSKAGSSKDKETEKKEGSSSKEGGGKDEGSKSERQRITGPSGSERKSGDRSRPSTSSTNNSHHGHGGPRREDKGRHGGGGVLTFNQIRDQRKRELEKEEERRRRDRERRKREEDDR